MTYITDAMERILLDSLADRAATEQSRRKTVTQSRGASAEPSAMPAGPPAFRHTVELGGPVSFCRPPVATPGRWGSGHDVQTQAVVPVGIAQRPKADHRSGGGSPRRGRPPPAPAP